MQENRYSCQVQKYKNSQVRVQHCSWKVRHDVFITIKHAARGIKDTSDRSPKTDAEATCGVDDTDTDMND